MDPSGSQPEGMLDPISKELMPICVHRLRPNRRPSPYLATRYATPEASPSPLLSSAHNSSWNSLLHSNPHSWIEERRRNTLEYPDPVSAPVSGNSTPDQDPIPSSSPPPYDSESEEEEELIRLPERTPTGLAQVPPSLPTDWEQFYYAHLQTGDENNRDQFRAHILNRLTEYLQTFSLLPQTENWMLLISFVR